MIKAYLMQDHPYFKEYVTTINKALSGYCQALKEVEEGWWSLSNIFMVFITAISHLSFATFPSTAITWLVQEGSSAPRHQVTGLHFPTLGWKGISRGPEAAARPALYSCLCPIPTKWPWISHLASLGFRLFTSKIRLCYSTNRSTMKWNMKVKDNSTSPTCLRKLYKH